MTSTWAHPRSRGENCPKKCFRRRKCGSSPLTRGKRRFVGITTIKRGLIPAHAGKTIQGRNPSGPTRAHPRSRGENVLRAILAIAGAGSSPLTRGKPGKRVLGVLVGGLIPAHAGKTADALRQAGHHRAHPRSRGENPVTGEPLLDGEGSSPLTRGKQCRADGTRQSQRLIPAHAGKTSGGGERGEGARAHPRSRGENVMSHAARFNRWGSSPLTRGKQP